MLRPGVKVLKDRVYIMSFSAEFRHPVEGSLYAACHRRSTLKFIDFQ